MIQRFDNYLLIHFSTYMSLPDFTKLTMTSHLFREPLVLDYLKQMICNSFSLNISNRIIIQDYSLREISNDLTEITFTNKNITYNFSGQYKENSVSLYNFETITITTPARQYEWSGYICKMSLDFDNDSNYRIYSLDYYNLKLVIYIDSYNTKINKIRFEYPSKVKHSFFKTILYFMNLLFDKTKQLYISFTNL